MCACECLCVEYHFMIPSLVRCERKVLRFGIEIPLEIDYITGYLPLPDFQKGGGGGGGAVFFQSSKSPQARSRPENTA